MAAQTLTSNFGLLAIGELISKLMAFVAFAQLARVLKPEAYGTLEFALAVTLFFNLGVEGGLGLVGAREVAKEGRIIPWLTTHVLALRGILAISAYLLLILSIAISNKSGGEKQLVMLYGLTLFGTAGLLQWIFQGLDRMQWVAISSVVRWGVFVAGIYFLVGSPSQVFWVPMIEVAAIGIVVLLQFAVLRRSAEWGWQPFHINSAISLIRQALPIGLTQIMWGLKIYFPTIILGLLVGGKEVGWYGSASRVVLAIHSLVWIYFFNLYPSISRCALKTEGTLQELIGRSLQLTSWAAVFIGVFGTMAAAPLMDFIYGSQYAEAGMAFQILIWMVSFSLLSDHYRYTLIAFNYQKNELFADACGAGLNVVLNVFLVPRYGMLGAAAALISSEALIWGLAYTFVVRKIGTIRFSPHLLKPLISAAGMATIWLCLPGHNVWMNGSIGAGIYAIGVMILQPNLLHGAQR